MRSPAGSRVNDPFTFCSKGMAELQELPPEPPPWQAQIDVEKPPALHKSTGSRGLSPPRQTSLYKRKEHTCTSVKGRALKAPGAAPRASPPSLQGLIHDSPSAAEAASDASPRQGQKLPMSKAPGRAGCCSEALPWGSNTHGHPQPSGKSLHSEQRIPL